MQFQAENEMNDGTFEYLTNSCPADALEDWNIKRGRALAATAVVASLR